MRMLLRREKSMAKMMLSQERSYNKLTLGCGFFLLTLCSNWLWEFHSSFGLDNVFSTFPNIIIFSFYLSQRRASFFCTDFHH